MAIGTGDKVQFTHKRERPNGEFLERTIRGVVVDVIEGHAKVSTGGEPLDVPVEELKLYDPKRPKFEDRDPNIKMPARKPSPAMKALEDEFRGRAKAEAEKAK